MSRREASEVDRNHRIIRVPLAPHHRGLTARKLVRSLTLAARIRCRRHDGVPIRSARQPGVKADSIPFAHGLGRERVTMHDFPLLTTLAAGFTAAWILGIITQRIGLSPIVGYILAGVAIGPYTPGFMGDAEIATQLAANFCRTIMGKTRARASLLRLRLPATAR